MTIASAPATASSKLTAVPPLRVATCVGARRIRVDDVERVDLVHGAEQVGVHAAHAPGADDGDPHRSSSRNAYVSTRRPTAAASAGRSHDESCSTMSHPR